MAIAQSKLTAQGQISVPAEIRKKLGVGPGSVLEWENRGGEIVVRKAGRFTSADVHAALFGRTTDAAREKSMKEGTGGTSANGMRAIDTNVLVRLLVRDDPRQCEAAEGFIAKGAWVSHLVLVETVWVLDACMAARRTKSRAQSRSCSRTRS